MKFRQGFVSNSSSCSFVVIGYKIPKDESYYEMLLERLIPEQWESYKEKYINGKGLSKSDIKSHITEMIYELPYDMYDNDENGFDSDTHMVIGDEISSGDNNILERNEINLNTYSIPSLEKIFNDENIKYEYVLITGTRMC